MVVRDTSSARRAAWDDARTLAWRWERFRAGRERRGAPGPSVRELRAVAALEREAAAVIAGARRVGLRAVPLPSAATLGAPHGLAGPRRRASAPFRAARASERLLAFRVASRDFAAIEEALRDAAHAHDELAVHLEEAAEAAEARAVLRAAMRG